MQNYIEAVKFEVDWMGFVIAQPRSAVYRRFSPNERPMRAVPLEYETMPRCDLHRGINNTYNGVFLESMDALESNCTKYNARVIERIC
jgi:hypothetical protein